MSAISPQYLYQGVLMHLASLSRGGELQLTKAMGIEDSELLKRIESLSASELTALSERYKARFIHFTVESETLKIILDDLDNEKVINELFMCGAPNELMHELYRITGKVCAARRKILGFSGCIKRKPESVEEEELIAGLWARFTQDKDTNELTGQDWLDFHAIVKERHRETNLRVIWKAIQQYDSLKWVEQGVM